MVNGDVLHSYKHIGHKRTLQSTVVQSASVKCLNMSWLDTVEEILDLVISYFSSSYITYLSSSSPMGHKASTICRHLSLSFVIY